ncbi:hypothetical protein BN946_scf184938.g17 [Trametes cinnabarina]|uniref:RING-type E3 ubiquitin transferase n=1 Tax=Pycnoporus cinnabarinus TaxID=5643 RepID=A0A060S1J5_PYCCI|nr:hypothetical protein BN946_scf184938.g17 [Trametes cinnabarina]
MLRLALACNLAMGLPSLATNTVVADLLILAFLHSGGMNTQNDEPRDLENGIETPRQQRSSWPTFLFITFVLFMLTNGRGEDVSSTRDQYVDGLQSLNYQLLNYSAWLNGTASNFSLPVEDPNTIPLASAFIKFGSKLDPQEGSYYSNLTGFWHGDLGFHNLTSLNASEAASSWRHLSEQFILPTNLSSIPDLLGPWNFTRSNKVTLSIGDKLVAFKHNDTESKDIAIIHGKVDLSEPGNSEELRLDFEGIHILSTGTVYAMAESTGHGLDLRSLPALVPETFRNDSARAVEMELAARISKLGEKIESGAYDQDSADADDSPKTKCSFRLFAQLAPTDVPKELMDELEQEIEKPTGITTVRAPELAIDAVLLSQNCGMLYEIKDVSGVQSQRLYRKISSYSGFATLVNLALLALFRRQAANSSSAVGLSRVSRYTFLIQSLIDAISLIGQMAVLIGQIQAPEDAPSVRPSPPSPAVTTTQPTTSPAQAEDTNAQAVPTQPPAPAPATPALPPPTTPTRPSFLQFLWNHIRTDPAARLWTLLSLSFIVVFRVVIALSLPLFFIALLYTCMWMMQIYRSARRSRSSGLSAEYLVGTTLGRLFFVCYFLVCPKNILDVEPRSWIYGVGILMFLQILVILLQERLGPAFFLPKGLSRTQTYDYHPPMPLPDPESPDQSLGDCAICMDAILVDPSLRRRSKSSDGKERPVIGRATGILGKVGGTRKTYSLAPCHHLFHTACLERWLAIKVNLLLNGLVLVV